MKNTIDRLNFWKREKTGLMLDPNKKGKRLHKKLSLFCSRNLENRIGQGVFHIFHRVFHTLKETSTSSYVNWRKRQGKGDLKKVYFFIKCIKIYFLGKGERAAGEGLKKGEEREIGAEAALPVFLFEICGGICYNVFTL